MARKSRITYNDVRKIALAFPNVEESTSYGTPALKTKRKLFVRLREPDVIVIKMSFEQRKQLMSADPETYFITDHYLNYPWMLVRLSKVKMKALQELLQIAYRTALRPKDHLILKG